MRKPLKQEAGVLSLIFASLGSMIGSGWLFGPLHAAQIAGPYSLIAWFIGGVAIMLLAMVYAELTALMPYSGAVIHFPRISHGELAARIYSWINFLGYVCIAPVETMAIISYTNNIWPGLTTYAGVLTTTGLTCACLLLGFFTLINFLSIRWVLRINNWTMWWKLSIPILTIFLLIFISNHNNNLMIHEKTLARSWPEILHAISASGIIFSFLGFRQAVELAGESRNSSYVLPLSIIGSVGIGLLLYLGLQYAFLISVPSYSLHNGWGHLKFTGMAGPFAGLATIAGAGWLVNLLYIDAIVSPGGTAYIYITTSARVTLAMADSGLIPHIIQKLNKSGIPWVATLVSFVVGIIFLFPFPSWQKMVGAISSIALLAYAIGPVTLLSLRKNLPHLPRPFRLPFANIAASISFIISNFIIYWAGYKTVNFLFGFITIFFLSYLLHLKIISRKSLVTLPWRQSLWIGPYYLGLWFISFIMNYKIITFPWDLISISLLSLFILYLAVHSSSKEKEILLALASLDKLHDHSTPR